MALAKRVTPRYTAVAQALHWLIAIALVAMVGLGLFMVHGALGPATKFKLFQLHKSIGISVLLLASVRLLWRWTHRPPPLPADMPVAERLGAHAAHVVLYVLMLGLPLVGWAIVSLSAFNLPTVLFGVVPWPHLPGLATLPKPEKAYWEPVAKLAHAYGAYFLIGLVALHGLAALRHHLILRDDVLRRMLPKRRRDLSSVEG